MFSYFSIVHANEILPTVIKKFEFVTAKKNELTKIEQQLQIGLSDTSNFEEYVTIKRQLNTAVTNFIRR